jgi:hypothetical protein
MFQSIGLVKKLLLMFALCLGTANAGLEHCESAVRFVEDIKKFCEHNSVDVDDLSYHYLKPLFEKIQLKNLPYFQNLLKEKFEARVVEMRKNAEAR